MALAQHLKYIMEGVDKWNAWRNATPGSMPDLSGADLSGRDLSRAILAAYQF